VGPLAWPTAYEDVVGFAFWPQQYGQRLRQHSVGDVLNTLFKPGALASRTRAEMTRVATASNRPGTAAGAAAGDCGDGSIVDANWPKAQIEHAIQLTPTQREALDELGAAVAKAAAAVKTNCRDEVAMPPVERVRAMQNTLWMVRDAAILIRTPLARFYNSLTDEQKEPFVDSSPPPPDLRALATGEPSAKRDEILKMCGMSGSGEWPTRLIEQFLQPNAAQRASLESLQKKTYEMAQFLLASCLQPIPPAPNARLDVAIDRLTAVIFATSQISLALKDMYNQLDDKQKAKIDSLGGRQ
jgi:hypothetical protein